MAFGYESAASIINDAAVEIGLYTTDIADPFSSTDDNVLQLCRLLKSLGREIIRDKNWSQALKTFTFVTVGGTSTYSLPSDFLDMIDQTGWNRTNRLPLGGPLSPQEWEYLKARLVGVTFNVLFRPRNGLIELYPDTNTPDGYTIAFEYMSRNFIQPQASAWVALTSYAVGTQVINSSNVYTCITAGTSAGSGGPTTTSTNITDGTAHWAYRCADGISLDIPSVYNDLVCFDSLLMVRGLQLKFLTMKGFDTTAAQAAYDSAFEKTRSNDTQSPILSLNGAGRTVRERTIDGNNLPITGFGS